MKKLVRISIKLILLLFFLKSYFTCYIDDGEWLAESLAYGIFLPAGIMMLIMIAFHCLCRVMKISDLSLSASSNEGIILSLALFLIVILTQKHEIFRLSLLVTIVLCTAHVFVKVGLDLWRDFQNLPPQYRLQDFRNLAPKYHVMGKKNLIRIGIHLTLLLLSSKLYLSYYYYMGDALSVKHGHLYIYVYSIFLPAGIMMLITLLFNFLCRVINKLEVSFSAMINEGVIISLILLLVLIFMPDAKDPIDGMKLFDAWVSAICSAIVLCGAHVLVKILVPIGYKLAGRLKKDSV